MSKEVKDILTSSLRTIESCMFKKIKDKIGIYEQEFYEQKGFAIIQEEIERMEQEIMALNCKLRELQNQKNNLNKQVNTSPEVYGIIDSFPREAIIKMHGAAQKELSIHVAERIKNDKEYVNYIARTEIRRGYEQTFSLAATAKEKRNIVLKLYSINRNELGIEIPPSFLEKTNVVISNGRIQTMALPNN